MTKLYAGDRTIDGIVVTVDGEPLSTHIEHHLYSRNGFEWGYEGAESSQLAFAMLVDHLADPKRAAELQDRFMRSVVAYLPNEWELTSADVDQELGRL